MWSISLHALGPPAISDALLECHRSAGRRLMTATRRLPLLLSGRLHELLSLPPLANRNGHGDDGADQEGESERERIGVSFAAQGPLAERGQTGAPSVALGSVTFRQRGGFDLAKERPARLALDCGRCGGRWMRREAWASPSRGGWLREALVGSDHRWRRGLAGGALQDRAEQAAAAHRQPAEPCTEAVALWPALT